MAERPSPLDRCFQQGTEARLNGRTRADNPYAIDTDEHAEWAAGWSATPDLDEDEDPSSTRIDAGDMRDGADLDSTGPDADRPRPPRTRA